MTWISGNQNIVAIRRPWCARRKLIERIPARSPINMPLTIISQLVRYHLLWRISNYSRHPSAYPGVRTGGFDSRVRQSLAIGNAMGAAESRRRIKHRRSTGIQRKDGRRRCGRLQQAAALLGSF